MNKLSPGLNLNQEQQQHGQNGKNIISALIGRGSSIINSEIFPTQFYSTGITVWLGLRFVVVKGVLLT